MTGLRSCPWLGISQPIATGSAKENMPNLGASWNSRASGGPRTSSTRAERPDTNFDENGPSQVKTGAVNQIQNNASKKKNSLSILKKCKM